MISRIGFASARRTWNTPSSAGFPTIRPAGLGAVMRYAVLDGGKRLRPLLVMAAAEAVSGDCTAALRAAVSVELIHAYSLVHDDMPCMDNDVLRRGKPTVHVKYGEAQAMLAGDAMQALAFEVLTPDEGLSPQLMSTLVRLLARASGPRRHGRRPGHRPGQRRPPPRRIARCATCTAARPACCCRPACMMGAACGPADATALKR
jgi:farnesyl diphosphate synthase